MQYQPSRVESYSIVQGLISVISANGAGIAEAVRKGSGWIPAGIVAVGGLTTGFTGIVWSLFIWVMLSCICWVLFLITATPGSPRPHFRDAVQVCGWCMLPFALAALLLTVPRLIFSDTHILLLVAIWMVISLGAGWSALTGVTRVRATIAAVMGVGLTFLFQMVAWFVVLLLLLAITG